MSTSISDYFMRQIDLFSGDASSFTQLNQNKEHIFTFTIKNKKLKDVCSVLTES